MLKKVLAAVCLGLGSSVVFAYSMPTPYKDKANNLIYNLLFCDQPDLFKKQAQKERQPPWNILFNNPPDFEAIARIAADTTQEARVRALSFNILRKAGKPVPAKVLLATIIEVRLPDGLDTLAVFADGGARYINYSGKLVIVEGTPNPFAKEIKDVLATSAPIVAAIGPWDKARLAAPEPGNVRMSFIVSDGLYFGEGPMDALQKDAMASPLISAATHLLMKLTKKAIRE